LPVKRKQKRRATWDRRQQNYNDRNHMLFHPFLRTRGFFTVYRCPSATHQTKTVRSR
jgi:hypothetical protein